MGRWNNDQKKKKFKCSTCLLIFFLPNPLQYYAVQTARSLWLWAWVGSRSRRAPSLLNSFALQRSLPSRHPHTVFHSREMDRVCIYQCVYWRSKCPFHSSDPAWIKNLAKQKQQHPNSVWDWAWSWCADERLSCPQAHSWAWAVVLRAVTADQQHFCNSCPASNKGEQLSSKTACWQNPVL